MLQGKLKKSMLGIGLAVLLVSVSVFAGVSAKKTANDSAPEVLSGADADNAGILGGSMNLTEEAEGLATEKFRPQWIQLEGEQLDHASFGSFDLEAGREYTVTMYWNEGGFLTLNFESEKQQYEEELEFQHGVPVRITVPESGAYRFVYSRENEISDVIFYIEEAIGDIPVQSTEKIIVEGAELRLPQDSDAGYPYIQDTVTNSTNKTIVKYKRGQLAYDKDGNPLEIYWNGLDSSNPKSYSFLYDWGSEIIQPQQTTVPDGGWTLMNQYGDAETKKYDEIAYVLFNFKEVTFSDGTVWKNPEYDSWLETYEGETVSIDVLDAFYPFVLELES